jgi:hypothetical protein
MQFIFTNQKPLTMKLLQVIYIFILFPIFTFAQQEEVEFLGKHITTVVEERGDYDRSGYEDNMKYIIYKHNSNDGVTIHYFNNDNICKEISVVMPVNLQQIIIKRLNKNFEYITNKTWIQSETNTSIYIKNMNTNFFLLQFEK